MNLLRYFSRAQARPAGHSLAKLKEIGLKTRPLDRGAIRKRVQALFECDVEEGDAPGAKLPLSKVETDRFVPSPTLSVDGIKDYICANFKVEDLNVVINRTDSAVASAHIILSSPQVSWRKGLKESLLQAYRPLCPKRHVPVEADGDCSWIVLDICGIFVHIFDPATRLEVNLDAIVDGQ